ncbi:hypothetical protein EI94DRAFT_1707698 [Lactarius quietus]|nr:hypothetical protein EI94DRAFT_1707698 [Lactarius quietus]
MATAQIPVFSPHIVNGVYEVASHHVGKTLLETILNCFPSGKIRRGNYYVTRSRTMLAQYYERLEDQDQDAIEHEFTSTMDAKDKLRGVKGPGYVLKKYSLAKEYKQVAKSLFIIVEISRARAERAAQQPPIGTTTTHSNPFSDSHETSSLDDALDDVDVGNLSRFELSVFQSTNAREAAVVVGMENWDGTTQEVSSAFPLPGVRGDMTNEGAGKHYESTALEGRDEPPTERGERGSLVWPKGGRRAESTRERREVYNVYDWGEGRGVGREPHANEPS